MKEEDTPDSEYERRVSALRWVDNDLRKLVAAVRRAAPAGAASVAFGDVSRASADDFESLPGTLSAARRRGIVAWDGPALLFSPVHDAVVLRLVRDTVPDSALPPRDHVERRLPAPPPRPAGQPAEAAGVRGGFCACCGKQVPAAERVEAARMVFHRQCFVCSQCRCQLKPAEFCMINRSLYCRPHYMQSFQSKVEEEAPASARELWQKYKEDPKTKAEEEAERRREEERQRKLQLAEEESKKRQELLEASAARRAAAQHAQHAQHGARCPACGKAADVANARFCIGCGGAIPEPQAATPPAAAAGHPRCPHCKAALSAPNARFCTACGKTVPHPHDAQAIPGTACPSCRAPLTEKGAKFCTKCGGSVPAGSGVAPAPAAPKCPSCKEALTPGDRFCTGCGKAVPHGQNNHSHAAFPPAPSHPAPPAPAKPALTPRAGAVLTTPGLKPGVAAPKPVAAVVPQFPATRPLPSPRASAEIKSAAEGRAKTPPPSPQRPATGSSATPNRAPAQQHRVMTPQGSREEPKVGSAGGSFVSRFREGARLSFGAVKTKPRSDTLISSPPMPDELPACVVSPRALTADKYATVKETRSKPRSNTFLSSPPLPDDTASESTLSRSDSVFSSGTGTYRPRKRGKPTLPAVGREWELANLFVQYLWLNGTYETDVFKGFLFGDEGERLWRLMMSGGAPRTVADMEKFSCNSISMCLKRLLLCHDPLFPYEHYDTLMAIERTSRGPNGRLLCIAEVVTKVPTGNAVVLYKLLSLLSEVAEHSDVTGSDVCTLGYTFGPVLIRPRSLRAPQDPKNGAELRQISASTKFANSLISDMITNVEAVFEGVPAIINYHRSENKKALEELHAQERAFEARKSEHEGAKNDASVGVVKRNKTTNELEKLLAEDPLPLRKGTVKRTTSKT
eukprot:m51a1_g4969 hypothetical protein (910) ;mRNA; f:391631-395112